MVNRKKIKKLEEHSKDVFEGVTKLSEHFYYFGGTIALLVLLSSTMYEAPTIEVRASIDGAYAAWCAEWQQQCAGLISAPVPDLLCVMRDQNLDDDAERHKHLGFAYADDLLSGEIGPAGSSESQLLTGFMFLKLVYPCKSATFSNWERSPQAGGCRYNRSLLLDLVTFANTSEPGTSELRNQCIARTNWLANAAWNFRVYYQICNFPFFVEFYIISSILVLLAISFSYLLHSMGKASANQTGKLLRLTRTEALIDLLGACALLGIALGGMVQAFYYGDCFTYLQHTVALLFSFVIFAVAIYAIVLGTLYLNLTKKVTNDYSSSQLELAENSKSAPDDSTPDQLASSTAEVGSDAAGVHAT